MVEYDIIKKRLLITIEKSHNRLFYRVDINEFYRKNETRTPKTYYINIILIRFVYKYINLRLFDNIKVRRKINGSRYTCIRN